MSVTVSFLLSSVDELCEEWIWIQVIMTGHAAHVDHEARANYAELAGHADHASHALWARIEKNTE